MIDGKEREPMSLEKKYSSFSPLGRRSIAVDQILSASISAIAFVANSQLSQCLQDSQTSTKGKNGALEVANFLLWASLHVFLCGVDLTTRPGAMTASHIPSLSTNGTSSCNSSIRPASHNHVSSLCVWVEG